MNTFLKMSFCEKIIDFFLNTILSDISKNEKRGNHYDLDNDDKKYELFKKLINWNYRKHY